jgi:mRNA-degrading endonuclease RelE of RelBE toxin-antitoxin system
MSATFDVRTTSRFDRELKKLARAQRNEIEEYEK